MENYFSEYGTLNLRVDIVTTLFVGLDLLMQGFTDLILYICIVNGIIPSVKFGDHLVEKVNVREVMQVDLRIEVESSMRLLRRLHLPTKVL